MVTVSLSSHILAALPLLQEGESVGTPAWVPIVILVIILLLFWWGLNREPIDLDANGHDGHSDDGHGDSHDAHTTHDGGHHDEMPEVPTRITAVVAEPISEPQVMQPVAEPKKEKDNLKRIEGIGPKISSILNDAGIYTFSQLANKTVDDLVKIVQIDAGISVAYPDTWPEQAKLADAGQWDELKKLQDELKGGRRISRIG